mmetsp:Transcript_76896/g.135472  ORF Transcript_76896/g.135472 Transcript_76896/m.135472 type:complete len:662 (+) Transcript_76896:41-2026(+)
MTSACGFILDSCCRIRGSGQDNIDLFFQAQVDTTFGSQVLVVGNHLTLGSWLPHEGIVLKTSAEDYPTWTAQVALSSCVKLQSLEYKFLVQLPDGSYIWEAGDNRQVQNVTIPKAVPVPLDSCGWQEDPVLITWTTQWSDSHPGDRLAVVGSCAELGSWSPSTALRCNTTASTFPTWEATAHVKLPLAGPGRHVTWKLVALRGNGEVMWEAVQDRVSYLPADKRQGCYSIRASFGQESEDIQAVELAKMGLGKLDAEDGIGRSLTARIWQSSLQLQQPTWSKVQEGVARSTSSASASTQAATECDGSEEDLSPHSDEESCEVSSVDVSSLTKVLVDILSSSSSASVSQAGLWPSACRLSKLNAPCEDSFFYCADAMGVADGVGQMVQFSKYGADSAAYAADLMSRAAEALQQGDPDEAPETRAANSLAFAEKEAQTYGASTACVFVLDADAEEGVISAGVANLGDSGFMVLRKSQTEGQPVMEAVMRSAEQQHSFNFPYQLIRLPPALAKRVPAGRKFDSAADCEMYEVELRLGDLLLVYTDGLVDNLHDHEILHIVNSSLNDLSSDDDGKGSQSPLLPDAIAKALATEAQKRSLDPEAEVPFAETSRLHGLESEGGKQDDITVVAAWVMPTCSMNDAATASGASGSFGNLVLGDVLTGSV